MTAEGRDVQSSGVPLFDDKVIDARMRKTIPEFALLGAVIVAATIPLAVPTLSARLVVLGLAVLAALSSGILRIRNLIGMLPLGPLFFLLGSYCLIIAVAVLATGDPASPYRLVFLVPVLFTATFFTGPIRYAMAVVAPVMEHVVAGDVLGLEPRGTVVRIAIFLFVAHFGAVVSHTLRTALRSNRALHTVLEAASDSPLDADLATTGLQAALEVAGWTASALFLPEGDALKVSAAHPDPALLGLDGVPEIPLDPGTSSVAAVFRSKETLFIPDVAAARGADHVLVKAGMRSVAILPLVHHGTAIGVLLIGDRAVRAADDVTTKRLDRVANQIALAIGSAAAYRAEMEMSAQLRELNQRKDEFLGNVSHELRTPAAAIKLIATMLANDAGRIPPDRLPEMYSTLERRAAHLAELIDALLEEAVAEAGVVRLNVAPIDWRDAVVRWAEIAQLQTGRQISLHIPSGPVLGEGDAVKLERVVANLLSNAAKFSPEDTPIVVALAGGRDAIELSVTDQGIGIAAADVDEIFTRFHQVEGSHTRIAGGFGIGLSLTRHFVEAHGGTISVESAPGAGSTFTVRIPRRQPHHLAAPGGSQPLSHPQG